ncbi:MAG: hypothetical protein HQ462_08740, partial [Deltaproteobacteria bacterium]|nr:hypothetical protein [Deltaproteobacteria bacterium]
SEDEFNQLLTMNKMYNFADYDKLLNLKKWADKKYLPCHFVVSDVGVSELYWAAKGTAVLHHWVHLYDGLLGGRAQYGYLVPYLADSISRLYDNQGPTSFVRLAWMIYFCISILYSLFLFLIFKKRPLFAFVMVLITLYMYTKMGQFILLLAPGFHLQRATILLAVGLIWGKLYVTDLKRFSNVIFILLLLILCYLVDPAFALIGYAAAMTSLILMKKAYWWRTIFERRRNIILMSLVGVIGFGCILLFSSSMLYIQDKLFNGEPGLFKFTLVDYVREFCLFGVVAVYTWVYRYTGSPIAIYSVIVAFFVSFYYLITPDSFHFKYQIICSVPFLGWVLISFTDYVHRFSTLNPGARIFGYRICSTDKFPNFSKIGVGFSITSLIVAIIYNVISVPNEFHLRTNYIDSSYLSSTKILNINGKKIDADLSDKAQRILNSYPIGYKGITVSELDKYIEFIYGIKNGFDSPDLVSWIDSDKKLNALLRNTRGFIFIIDKEASYINLSKQLLYSHPILGSMAIASKIKTSGLIRVRDFTTHIEGMCSKIYFNTYWNVFQC